MRAPLFHSDPRPRSRFARRYQGGWGGSAAQDVHRTTFFSMRRSGISHMIATATYNASAAHEYANASGIATTYSSTDSLSLNWLPSACARADVLPWSAMRVRARM